MHVEECCQVLLAHFLPLVDRSRQGTCIDIGVGTFALYCELFARLGYNTVAIEPLPTEHLKSVCQQNKIRLIEACITGQDGISTLYIGQFQGDENQNLSSILPDWWGVSSKQISVKTMTLSTMLMEFSAKKITCLKLDVEGAEMLIIPQLLLLSQQCLPDVIMFEYGGGCTRQEGGGGWSPRYLGATMNCLSDLKRLGYQYAIVVDSGEGTKERVVNLATSSMEMDEYFGKDFIYGNIIIFRDFVPEIPSIEKICALFRDMSLPAPTVPLPKSGRVWNLLRRLFLPLNR